MSEVIQPDDLKPCAHCASIPLVQDDKASCSKDKCLASYKMASFEEWNSRPSDFVLKKAIDELLNGIKYVVDNQFTHNMNTRKLKQVRATAIAILMSANPKGKKK